MTDFQASLCAYSYMGRVHVGMTVHEFTPAGEPNLVVSQRSTDVLDDGEDDPTEYLKNALIAALEAL